MNVVAKVENGAPLQETKFVGVLALRNNQNVRKMLQDKLRLFSEGHVAVPCDYFHNTYNCSSSEIPLIK